MAKSNNKRMKLPHEHLSPITWAAIAAVALMIATYIVWAVWFAEPTLMR